MFQERLVYLVAAIAEADVAHANTLVGAEDPGIAKRRSKRGGAREIASGHIRHTGSPAKAQPQTELHLTHRVGGCNLAEGRAGPGARPGIRKVHQVERIAHL